MNRMGLESNLALFESEKYRNAIADSGDAIAIIDEGYYYIFASKTLMQYMGLTKAEIMGHTVPEVLGQEIFNTELKPYLDKCLQGKRMTFEMPFRTSRLGSRYFHLKCYPVNEKGVKTAVLVGRDITQLKRRERSLRWEREIFHIVLNGVNDILLVIDPQGIVITGCRYIDRQTGISVKSIIGQSVQNILTPDSYETVQKHLETWKNSNAHNEMWEAEVISRKGGTVPFEVRSTPVYEKGILKWIIVIARNILEREHMKEQSKRNYRELEVKLKTLSRESEEKMQQIREEFQQLSGRLLEDQERERNAIGRELHDEVGGYLTILGIYLSKMTKEPENPAWRAQFTQTLDEMVQYVRSLSHSLYPIMLEKGDLLAALEAYFESYGRRTEIRVIFKHKGLEERLPSHIEAVIYRIIQEALTNAVKHASADTVKVTVTRLKTIVKLYVEDNGHGFDVSKIMPEKSYGISGMKNRALFAGGNLEIQSVPEQGTIITAMLPIITSQRRKSLLLPRKNNTILPK